MAVRIQPEVIAALLSAGATEEIIAAAERKLGNFPPRPGGRPPRKYANAAARRKAYRDRKRRDVTRDVTAPDEAPEPPRQRYELHTDPYLRSLRVRLIDAANGNVDGFADLTPISM